MNPVTTGPGISGTLNDDLVRLIFDIRKKSKDQRWRLYIEAPRSLQCSLRVYAPDLHSEVHSVIKSLNTLDAIREILASEMQAWLSRTPQTNALASVQVTS
jgi:hypothetical protein